ncbi:MAG: hypothetical protein Q4G69_04295 [Planctomycetia bacterium]|nr:hypothetical protein [Planctomycetia bacterium]
MKWSLLLGIAVGALLIGSGCQSLNESEESKRFWYPSLESPGYLDPEHERYTPEGSDPYPDGTVGPKAFQLRPRGYDMQRSKAYQVDQNQSVQIK